MNINSMNIKPLCVLSLAEKAGILGHILIYRSWGQKTKDLILSYVEERMKPGDVLELDFEGVSYCDSVFLDEIVLGVQLVILKKQDNIMYLSNINSSIEESLRHVISWRKDAKVQKITVLFYQGGRFNYMGHLEPMASRVFEIVSIKGKITARELSDMLGTAIYNASALLKKLYDNRLVMRREFSDSTGLSHQYILPRKRIKQTEA